MGRSCGPASFALAIYQHVQFRRGRRPCQGAPPGLDVAVRPVADPRGRLRRCDFVVVAMFALKTVVATVLFDHMSTNSQICLYYQAPDGGRRRMFP